MTLRNELYTLPPRKRNILKPYRRGPPEKITVRRGHSDFKAVLCRVVSNTNQLANQAFTFDNSLPLTTIWFAQHQGAMAEHVLSEIVTRISQEGTRRRNASVLFAVMDIDGEGQNPVYDASKALHSNTGLGKADIAMPILGELPDNATIPPDVENPYRHFLRSPGATISIEQPSVCRTCKTFPI